MRLGIIYRATSPSGKCYIGSTLNLLNIRISGHTHTANTLNSKSKFSKAIRKYGRSLKWEILHRNIPENLLEHLEFDEIEVHNSCNQGYNSSPTGRPKGVPASDEKKKKQSERMTGEKNPFYQKKHPPRTFGSNEFKVEKVSVDLKNSRIGGVK